MKELQFIELPKFKKDKPKRDMSKFEKWLLALKFGEIYANDLENLPEELKEEEEIVMALHELVRASNDDMIREILEMRSKARHDEASRLYQAEMKGKEDVAKNLLEMDMPIEKIAKATGISVEEIEKLKQIRN